VNNGIIHKYLTKLYIYIYIYNGIIHKYLTKLYMYIYIIKTQISITLKKIKIISNSKEFNNFKSYMLQDSYSALVS